jgi:hypothetical protein
MHSEITTEQEKVCFISDQPLRTDLRKKESHLAESYQQDAEGKMLSLPKGRFFRAERPYSPGGEGVGFPDGG